MKRTLCQSTRLNRPTQAVLPKRPLAAAAILTLAAMPVYGASLTWDTDAAGNWTDPTNWVGNADYANGADETATFGNFITADRIVTLDAPITIGNITASDTSHNYTISGANVLTLDRTDATKPTINVTQSTRTLTISSQIAGTDGLQKTGAGLLLLSNASNSYSGETVINGGGLQAANAGALGASSAIRFTGNGYLQPNHSANPTFFQSVIIDPGVIGQLNALNQFHHMNFSGVVSGTGTLWVTSTDNGVGNVTFTNTGNTHTGIVRIGSAGKAGNLVTAGIADGVGAGAIELGNTSGAGNLTFQNTIAPQNFANRVLTLAGTAGGGSITNNGAHAVTFSQNLAITANGAKTLTLGGSNTGLNSFDGNVGDSGAGATSITKSGSGTWALSGTNTYTGATRIAAGNGTLIFQDADDSLPSATTLDFEITSNQNGTIRLLSDTSGTINYGNSIRTVGGGSSGTGTMTLFVGNNGAANLGNGAGGTTDSTIVLGTLDFRSGTEVAGRVDSRMASKFNITGANGYDLEVGDVILQGIGTGSANGAFLNPTTASLTITGTVKQANGKTAAGVAANQKLTLDGTSTGNLISGAIKNATDFDDSSNVNAAAMALVKSNSSTWTLSGTNTYTGTTTISGGKLLLSSTGSLASGSAVTVSGGALGGTGTVNGTVTVSSTGGIDLRDGVVGASPLTLGSTLNITGAAGANLLSFDLGNGTTTSDQLSVAGATTVTNTGAAVINLNQLGGSGGRTATTYTLIGGAGTLDATNFGKFSLATTAAFGQTYALVHDLVSDGGTGNLQVTAANVTSLEDAAFWAGGGNNWSTAGNWRASLAGNDAVAGAPDYQTNVTFSTTTPVPANLTTNVLDTDFNINSLTFTNASGNVTIGGTKMLTIEAAAVNGNTAGNGINSLKTSGTNTISAKVGLASSQTWTVASGGTLAVSGAISDFGGGYALTKAGAGTLTLSGTNSYTGGTFINAGIVNASAANLGGTGSNITFGGSATLNISAASTFGTLAVNSGTATFGTSNVTRSFASTTGSGNITFSGAGNSTGVLDLGNASAFTGNLRNDIGGIGNIPTKTLQFTSLGDGVGSSMQFGGGDGNGAQSVRYRLYGDAGPLTMTNRQLQLLTRTSSSNDLNRALLQNDNANPANKWVISPNLINTLRKSSTLELRGTNTGDNEFAGAIIDSTDAGAYSLNLTKVDAGKWILSSANNTFTGAITLGQNISGSDTRGSNNGTLSYASAGGANPITFNLTTGSATLSYIGSTDKTMSGAISASALTTGTITLDSSGTGAVNYSNSASLGSAGSGNKNLVLSGTNTGDNTLAGLWANNTGGAATLTKNGAGKWILSADHTYTGATNVNDGTLLITGSLVSGSTVTLDTDAILGGTGVIGGSVAANGTLAPGLSPGTLTISGTTTMVPTTILAFELNAGSTTVGGGINDLLTLADLTLDGTLNVTSNDPLGAGTWRLINYSGALTNNTLVIGSINLVSGYTASIDLSQANQVNLVVVPEPASLALLGLGGLMLSRRRRKVA